MATNTRRKTMPKVTPEVEQVVEEATYVEPEEFDLSKQVTVRSIADWSTGFKRITDFGGDLSIPKNGVVRLTRNEIIAQVHNGNTLINGIDGRGGHATLYIEDEATLRELGFDKQVRIDEDFVKEVFAKNNQSDFEITVKRHILTDAEKYRFMYIIAKLGMNDYSKIYFSEKHTGFRLDKVRSDMENNF